MNQGNSNIILIGNPMLDITFNDLFGPNGSIIDNYGPKERLLSFLQEIYPDDNINFVEFLEIPIYSFPVVCKYFVGQIKEPYYLAIQIYKLPYFMEEFLLKAANYLLRRPGNNLQSNELPNTRILSILLYEIDSTIFQYLSQAFSPNYIQLKFIQLPKIIEEGTNKKWLQILSAGATPKDLVLIDASKFNEEVYQSALKILESYSSDENYPKLQDCLIATSKFEAELNALYDEGRNQVLNEMKIKMNHNLIRNVLNLAGRFPIEKISEMLTVDITVVNFIVLTHLFWDQYLKKQHPTDQNLEEEIEKFFGFQSE